MDQGDLGLVADYHLGSCDVVPLDHYSTIIGDWYISGDLEGAMERAELRFWVMLEIISAVADSDS